MALDLSLWKEKLQTKQSNNLDQHLLDSESRSNSDSSLTNQEETRSKSKISQIFRLSVYIP